MSKFDQITQEMKDYINKHGSDKLEKGKDIDKTWTEIADEFNDKWEDEEFTPVSQYSIQLWAKKLNPNWREGKDNKTWVTPDRVEYVRDHMDTENEELQEETGLTEYVIKVIKEAKRDNFYKGADHNDRGGHNSKLDKMTDKMENWLREKAIDREDSWNDIKNQFNHKFGAAKIAPISENSANKWGKKLASEES